MSYLFGFDDESSVLLRKRRYIPRMMNGIPYLEMQKRAILGTLHHEGVPCKIFIYRFFLYSVIDQRTV